MAFTHAPPLLLTLWMSISSLLVLWDAAYIFTRPHSLPTSTHSIRYIWYPYILYHDVDHNYSLTSYKAGEGFPAAQSLLNVIESVLNLTYLWMLYGAGGKKGGGLFGESEKEKGERRRRELKAVLVGMTATVMTEAKTVLYWFVEVFGGWGAQEKSLWSIEKSKIFWLWIVPNGFWIVMPAWCAWQFAKDIARSVDVGEKNGSEAVKIENGKAKVN